MIEIKRLQKMVDQTPVTDIPSLTVQPGEIAAVVGPAGSGKQILLELLSGQSRPTLGGVQLAGINPLAERAEFSRRVGVLFANDSLYTRQSPRSNLQFQCRLRSLPRERVDEVLTQVGLADHANVRLDRLPSGLARRLALGVAILHRPQVLLLVEPFARCDEATIQLFNRLLRQMADEGSTLLILAADAHHLDRLCDAIYPLNQGRLGEAFRPAEAQPAQLPFKIPVRLEGRVALLNPADILYADVEEGRAYVQTVDGRLPTQFTLAELEQRLARSGFFRAHRGFLVNLQHVKEVIPYTRNSFSLRLDDAAGTKVPLSKSAAAELRELLGY